MKKQDFYMEKIIFIRYIVSAKNIEMNEKNIKIIQEWPKPILV
jgi:hypothetical protein